MRRCIEVAENRNSQRSLRREGGVILDARVIGRALKFDHLEHQERFVLSHFRGQQGRRLRAWGAALARDGFLRGCPDA
jgi:hypothetical protein